MILRKASNGTEDLHLHATGLTHGEHLPKGQGHSV